MKKRKTFISFILAFALCFGLTGCGMAQELANSYNTKELLWRPISREITRL